MRLTARNTAANSIPHTRGEKRPKWGCCTTLKTPWRAVFAMRMNRKFFRFSNASSRCSAIYSRNQKAGREWIVDNGEITQLWAASRMVMTQLLMSVPGNTGQCQDRAQSKKGPEKHDAYRDPTMQVRRHPKADVKRNEPPRKAAH